MLKRYFAFVALIFLSVLPVRAATIQDVLIYSVEDYIRPGYADFAATSVQMAEAMTDLCVDADEAALARARKEFAASVAAWAGIELVRFGPVMRDNRLERILFWPDRKSTGLKQVQRLLVAKNETATNLTSLRGKSVAVQGLGALEFILFGTGAQELSAGVETYRCRFGRTVAQALSFTADELVMLWAEGADFPRQFLNPDPISDSYRSDTEALSEIVGVMAHGLETVRDKRFKPILGSEIKMARPKRALFWRSELYLVATKANFSGLLNLMEHSRIGNLKPDTTTGILDSARFEFSNALKSHDRIEAATLDIAVDEQARGLIGYLIILTGSLQQIIGEQLATELGFAVGFSANDGD